ncbi:quinon protein alcohol dehydrogenase-like superfamily [Achaetomium macrosporum]|uniref:Quinon protein alcohol dehydrogenase-like superfamily n=1 Tax=Achaetomium macrosporum TaxID=79813 RepID=A0AAN7CHU0_9PEZI|nr:quinon protein alcohol dehydrogenase-like superfamily [Achaetomium macrosporum]
MKSGDVKLYQQSTCQQVAPLAHGEPVGKLRFDTTSKYLASTGFKMLKMWATEGRLLWTVPNATLLSAISFTEDSKYLVTADRYGNINTLNTLDGSKVPAELSADSSRKTSLSQGGLWRVIVSADICPKSELIAVGYRGWPPQIWSIQQDVMIGTCNLSRDKPGVYIISISQLLFNPNPAFELLAVAYQDGELAIFDKWPGGHEIEAVSGDALTLASTVDGRTLASGDARGTIKLWDFETLSLLYWIKSSEIEVRSLAFSADGFRLYDIRDTKTKIWEPSALVGIVISEDSSVSDSVHGPVPVIGRDRELIDIERILAPPEAGCIFAGRDDGSVVVYGSTTGNMVSSLYSHGMHAFVRSLSWNYDMIASADVSNNIAVYGLRKAESSHWAVTSQAFEGNSGVDGVIQELLLHPASPLLLVVMGSSTKLFNIHKQTEVPLSVESHGGYQSCLWLSFASGPVVLLGARATEPVIDIFAPGAGGLEYQPAAVWNLGTNQTSVASRIKAISTDAAGDHIAVLLENNPTDPRAPGLLTYEVSRLSLPGSIRDHTATFEDATLTVPASVIKTFLGFHGTLLVFLDHEFWVKSIDLSKCKAIGTLESHIDWDFFVPKEWIWSNNGVDGVVTDAGTVVFPKEGELAVVRHALEWTFTANDVTEKEITPLRRTGTLDIASRGGGRGS